MHRPDYRRKRKQELVHGIFACLTIVGFVSLLIILAGVIFTREPDPVIQEPAAATIKFATPTELAMEELQ